MEAVKKSAQIFKISWLNFIHEFILNQNELTMEQEKQLLCWSHGDNSFLNSRSSLILQSWESKVLIN